MKGGPACAVPPFLHILTYAAALSVLPGAPGRICACPAWTPTAPGHRRSRSSRPGPSLALRSGRPLCIPTPCKRSLSTAKPPQRAATSRSSAPNWSSPCFAHFATFAVPPVKNLCSLTIAFSRRKL
nr:MAG TPA: hypothetical protein [Caudoviricetes sp.]